MSENAVIGDTYGVEIPQTKVPKDQLDNEKKLAKFSKTKEFQRLKEHLEQRIEYYQAFLPDGRDVNQVDVENAGVNWKVANAIIGEFKYVIARYEEANEVIKDATKQRV